MRSTTFRYKITGSWDKPVITLIEKRDVTVTPVTPPLTGEPPTVKEPQQ